MIRCLPILLVLLTKLPVQAGNPMAGYLMGYFTESAEGQGNSRALHLATSEDGLDWMPLNQNEPVLVPSLGLKGLRDPFFLRTQDGGFVVLATDMANKDTDARQDIHVWNTADFITFGNERLLKLHDTPMQTLAPEAFFDPGRKQYGIIWSGNTDYHRTYINYTSDFEGISPCDVFFDPGSGVRDATLCGEPDHGGYFLYYKDSLANRLRGTRSPTLAPRGFDRNISANPPGEPAVGAPLVVKALHENRWILYGNSDSPASGGFYAWETGNIASDAWKEISRRDYNLPPNARHATVVPITRAELDRLIARWGRPRWNRLKAWNFPGFFVRNQDARLKLSPYPFDPYQDAQWRITPGLADEKGVSFESVNFPGTYVRTVAEFVVVSKNDGSPAFKTKATFLKLPGLADASWSSFRSLSAPDLYLRHAHFQLRLDPVSSPADKEDATFRIVY